MAFSLSLLFDTANNNSVQIVSSGQGYFAIDGQDTLFAGISGKTVLDGNYWSIPVGLSGGKGNDSYTINSDGFAIIADAGFGVDNLRIPRSLNETIWAAKVDGRHLAAAFQAFPGSRYLTTLLIIDAYKPEGSIETTTFDGNVILDTSYDKLDSLTRSSGIPFENLSWDQAIAKKYFNLSVLGVSNDSAGVAELIDLVYKTGNPITEAGVHRFFNPSKGVHFYSNDLNEVNTVRSRLGNYWYEGKVYDPVTGISASATQLYRFFNPKASYHFMTTSATEAATINNNPGWGYVQEGRSYTVSTQLSAEATTPVYRFYRINDGVGQHFYTSSEVERQSILSNPSLGYQPEGIAWYAK